MVWYQVIRAPDRNMSIIGLEEFDGEDLHVFDLRVFDDHDMAVDVPQHQAHDHAQRAMAKSPEFDIVLVRKRGERLDIVARKKTALEMMTEAVDGT